MIHIIKALTTIGPIVFKLAGALVSVVQITKTINEMMLPAPIKRKSINNKFVLDQEKKDKQFPNPFVNCISESHKDTIILRYKEGQIIAKLAKDAETSPSTISRILTERGLPPGSSHRLKKNRCKK